MSLLRFIKRDRTERPAPVAPVAPAPAAVAVAPPPPPASAFAAPPPAAPAAVDLERIRHELQEIQRIVGAEETVYGQVRAPQDAVEVNIKLSELVRLCPQAFKDPESLQQASQTVIQVAVPGLYDQLTKGRVTTKLHLLTADIPVDYLAPYAAEHAEDAVPLPLHMVVGSLQPEDLRRRTASQERDLGDKLLPNLFTPASVAAAAAAEAPAAPPPAEPVEAPVAAPAAASVAEVVPAPPAVVEEPAVAAELPVPVEAPVAPPEPEAVEPAALAVPAPVEPMPAPVEEPAAPVDAVPVYEIEAEPTPSPEPVSAAPVEADPLPVERVAEPVPMVDLPLVAAHAVEPAATPEEPAAEPSVSDEAPAEDDTASATRVLLSGLDLNSATAEEMHARLDGVGLKLAQRIVACRETGGPFTDLFDLARVSGLRARRFEQVTGLPWNAAYFRHREQVNQLLGVPAGAMPDVRQVAARFSEITDFSGCMLIHEDGLVLAQSWNHPAAEALGAFAPQMFKKIHRYVKPLKLGEMNSLCFFVGHQPITVVRSGTVYFAALHKPDKLTKKQVSLAQALAMELGRRFAHA